MRRRFDIGDFVNVTTKQSVKDDLVNRFKKRRAEFGISQKELSKRSGVSYGSIRRFESTGDVSPATKTYNVVNKTGKKLNTVDVKKGQRFPPTQSSENHYE